MSTTKQSIFVLSYISNDEMPDRDGFLLNGYPFASLDNAKSEAEHTVNDILEDETLQPNDFLWEEAPGYVFSPVTQAWIMVQAEHTFLIRECPLG